MAVVLFVVFVVVPVAEIAVIIEVGRVVGVGWTVALLLASAVIGSWLLRREGRRAWRAFSDALGRGRVPTREVADGALVIFGAALMIAPGFLTDLIGMLCLLPPTRAVMRGLLTTAAMRRLFGPRGTGRRTRPLHRPEQPRPSPGAGTRPEHPVVDGEVEP